MDSSWRDRSQQIINYDVLLKEKDGLADVAIAERMFVQSEGCDPLPSLRAALSRSVEEGSVFRDDKGAYHAAVKTVIASTILSE